MIRFGFDHDSMKKLSECNITELAFESANAIINLAGLRFCGDLKELQERIIRGELTFDDAVQLVIQQVRRNE